MPTPINTFNLAVKVEVMTDDPDDNISPEQVHNEMEDIKNTIIAFIGAMPKYYHGRSIIWNIETTQI